MDNTDKAINMVEVKSAIDGIIELAVPYARGVWAYYNALIEQGFTEAQALNIVLKHGMTPPAHGG